MAEVIGVVGSAINIAQLAAQIASSVMKLKSYLDQIKDAPEDIRILVESIELLQLSLAEIECDQARQQTMLLGTNSTLRSLDYCRRGVERLRRVVDDLGPDFEDAKSTKRKWAAAKMIWRRERIEKQRLNLNNVLRQLSLSFQMYTSSLIQIQPDIITSRIAQLMQLESFQAVSTNSLPSSIASEPKDLTSAVRTAGKDERPHPWKAQCKWTRWRAFHSLLLNRAWYLQICKSQQGWQFSMSVYAVVPSESPVVKYTEEGNIKELQRLFSSGQASPFTICPESRHYKSLFYIGAENASYEVCNFLINQGIDPNFEINRDSLTVTRSPLVQFVANSIIRRPNHKSHAKVAELFATNSEITINTLCLYRGPVAGFSTLLKYLDTPTDVLSDKKRCQIATETARGSNLSSPDVFLAALGCSPNSLSSLVYKNLDGNRQTLLHAALNAVGHLIECEKVHPYIAGPENHKEYIIGWTAITQDLLVGGADLHAISEKYKTRYGRVGIIMEDGPQKPCTPLLFLFRSCHQLDWTRHHPSIMHRALKWWIQTLYEANINLMDYGRKEKAVWDKVDVDREFTCYIGQSPFWKHFIGFSYGPSPNDWVFWENEPWAEFAGDFWLMVERKEEVMPGTWIE